jgi:hypothetical protein
MQIVLVGQPELEKRLSTSTLRQLDQRITVRVRLAPLTTGEIIAYINHRLIRAGKGFLKLDDRMVSLIRSFSGGIPRIINVIASRSIMSAYLEGHNVVTARHVRYAIDHLDGGGGSAARRKRVFPTVYAAGAAVFLGIALAAGYFFVFDNGAPSGTQAVEERHAEKGAAPGAVAAPVKAAAEKAARP